MNIDRDAVPYVYIMVRTDIPLAHQITQACHAALEIGFDHSRPQGPSNNDSPVHLVTLAIDDEESLMAFAHRLSMRNQRHHVFYEPDHYQGKPMGYTALSSAPVYGADRKIFRGFPLWHPEHAKDREKRFDKMEMVC